MALSSRTERLQHTEGEMVDGLHRGTGIVDRRREGLASDVDPLSGAESDVLLMVRSKPIRTSESAAAFKDPALASGRPARRPIPSQEQFPHHSTRVALIETSWSATTLRPKPTGMTVTMVVIIEMGSARAESAVPWKATRSNLDPGRRRSSRRRLPPVTQQRV
jgi:hypothetical protein